MSLAMPENPHYNPGKFLDTMKKIFQVTNDRRLSMRLGVQPPLISKIRRRSLAVPSTLLIDIHEETNIGIKELRALMGDFRPHTGPSASHPTLDQLDAIRRLATGRGRFMEPSNSAST